MSEIDVLTGIRQIWVANQNLPTKPTCNIEGWTVVGVPELSQNGVLFENQSASFCTIKIAVYVPGDTDPTSWQSAWRNVPVVIDFGNGGQLAAASAKVNGKPSVNHEDGTVEVEFYMTNINYIPGTAV